MKSRTSILLFVALVCSAYADFPNQRGEAIALKLPDGFTLIEKHNGQFDASNGDVLIAVARDEQKHEIRIFHASNVPVSDEEVPKFVEVMTSFFKNKPNAVVFASKVSRIDGRNWGRLEMEVNGSALLFLIYSLDGSPSRIEFAGPISDAASIGKFADVVIERLQNKTR